MPPLRPLAADHRPLVPAPRQPLLRTLISLSAATRGRVPVQRHRTHPPRAERNGGPLAVLVAGGGCDGQGGAQATGPLDRSVAAF